MEAFVHDFLQDYGPYAVFALLMLSAIGVALGEEMVTIPAGVLIAAGGMNAATTAIAAYVAIVLSDVLWFLVCRHYGRPLLHKAWFKRLAHPRRLLQVKHQLDARGVWLIVMARFIPSSRTTAITVAGIFHMKVLPFVLATALCTLVTVPLQLGLGWLIGRGMADEPIAHVLIRIIGLVALLSAAITVLGWWLRHRERKQRAPRAKMAWLRLPGRRRRSAVPASARATAREVSAAERAGGRGPAPAVPAPGSGAATERGPVPRKASA
jgi:membrane protein DedA with SNARE-associated domain